MAEKELNSRSDLEKVIRDGVTLVDFNAPWCGPCRAQEPIVNAVGERYNGKADIATMNIDNNSDVALNLGIQSIPTLIIFKDGQEVGRFVGLQKAETLNQAMDQALA
ncbi:MAG: thioredoxin [Deltaproteobacteria bacterium]|jgi:thioredoxin 1|nr:thioredoxin [Deltaproteobacteria bacterium]